MTSIDRDRMNAGTAHALQAAPADVDTYGDAPSVTWGGMVSLAIVAGRGAVVCEWDDADASGPWVTRCMARDRAETLFQRLTGVRP